MNVGGPKACPCVPFVGISLSILGHMENISCLWNYAIPSHPLGAHWELFPHAYWNQNCHSWFLCIASYIDSVQPNTRRPVYYKRVTISRPSVQRIIWSPSGVWKGKIAWFIIVADHFLWASDVNHWFKEDILLYIPRILVQTGDKDHIQWPINSIMSYF